jgi:hypothetical protein
MKKALPRLALTTPCLTLAIAIANALPMQAATVKYNFNISIDSGSLASNTYSGNFSYDDSTNKVIAFAFSFGSIDYDQGYDPNAVVSQSGSNFLGLIFAVDGSPSSPSFSFVPGSFDLSEAYFAYDPNINLEPAGFGSVLYERVNPPASDSVPAPLPVLGSAAFFTYSRNLRKRILKSRAIE